MLVSHSHRFVYLKTHKAAGSSIYRLLERFCAPPAFLQSPARATSAVHISSYGVTAQLIMRSADKYVPHYPLWDHSDLGQLARMFPDAFVRYHKIAAVRHPYDKVVSAYVFDYWDNRAADKDAIPLSATVLEKMFRGFAAYVARPREKLSHTMRHDREYFFWAGKFAINSIIRYEHLHSDLQALSNRLGLGLDMRTALPHIKKPAAESLRAQYRTFITPEIKAVIDDYYDWYFQQFGYEKIL